MSRPALIALEDGLIRKSSDNEWKSFSNSPRENTNPNPNVDFLVRKAAPHNQTTISPVLSRPLVKDESFRMVFPLAMSPPRDNAVPLPDLSDLMMNSRKKLGHQEFKCNAFCLSLPGFGKQKPLRSPRSEDSSKNKMIKVSSSSSKYSTVSLRASLEKFECGSWAAPTTALPQENGGLFFDLPLEMVKCSGKDMQEPVTSGFLFDKVTGGLALRGVLKTRSSLSLRQQRHSANTSPQRGVRFSAATSCPNSPRSCITPRLLKARDDFNAFLASQNT